MAVKEVSVEMKAWASTIDPVEESRKQARALYRTASVKFFQDSAEEPSAYSCKDGISILLCILQLNLGDVS